MKDLRLVFGMFILIFAWASGYCADVGLKGQCCAFMCMVAFTIILLIIETARQDCNEDEFEDNR
jgi:hypothetical protein